MALSDRHLSAEHEEALLPVNARIRHDHFGEGTIIGIDADKSAYVIRFDAARSVRMIAFKTRMQRA